MRSQSLRTAQSLQCLREPRARDDLPPLRFARSRVVVGRHIGASDHAHGFTKTETTLGGNALDLAEIFHHSAQPLAVNLHPTPSNQREPIGLSQQLADLGRVNVSPSSVTSMRKSSSASWPTPDSNLPPTLAVTCGRGGRFARQVAGIRTTTPALSSCGTSRRSCMASRRLPPQRVENLARIDHGLQPRAASDARCTGRSSDSRRSLLAAPAYSPQSLPQRKMLRLGVRRQPRGISRQKSEGRCFVLAVFGQVEVHAADKVPRRVAAFQETPGRRTSIPITPAQKRFAVLARETGEHLPSGTPLQSSGAPREPAKPVPHHRAAMDYALLWSRLHCPAECRGPSRSAPRILANRRRRRGVRLRVRLLRAGEDHGLIRAQRHSADVAQARAQEPMRRDLRSR